MNLSRPRRITDVKNTLLCPIVACLMMGLTIGGASGQSITITSPNGGETWNAGSTQVVTWDETGLGYHNYVGVYVQRGAEPAEVLGYAESDAHEFAWPICEFIGDASDYVIRVVCENCDPPVEDASDAPFAITGSTPIPSLTLTSPAGGELWQAGTIQTVTWDSTDPTGHVGVWLFGAGQRHEFLGCVPMAAGSLTWDINAFIGDGSDYEVGVIWQQPCGAGVEAFSAVPLTIAGSLPVPALTVTSPNGGEVLSADTTHVITWSSIDPSGDVELWLTDDVTRYEFLGVAPTSQGQFAWPIVPCIGDATDYRILLHWSSGQHTAEDMSDGTFELAGSTTSELAVTNPTAVDVWTAGTQRAITWSSDAAHGMVSVDLCQGEDVRLHLGLVAVADGVFTWDIPLAIGDSLYAVRLRLCDCAETFAGEEFEIVGSVEPTLVLTSPVGGETWEIGRPYNITWDTNLTGYVDVHVPYGDMWLHSGWVAVPAAAGSFTWPIAPSLPLGDETVLLRSYDNGPLATATADVSLTLGTAVPGDMDGDDDVDLSDIGQLQRLFTGRFPYMLLDPVADSLDVEPDGDVDVDDWTAFGTGITGP